VNEVAQYILPYNFVCIYCKVSFHWEKTCGIKKCPNGENCKGYYSGSFILSQDGAIRYLSDMAEGIEIKLDINTMKYNVETASYSGEVDFHDLILQYPKFEEFANISNEDIIRQLHTYGDLEKFVENIKYK
jgi:hypothetical protein